MKDIFKEGDRVFHIQYGWGTIKNVLNDMYVFDKGSEIFGFPKDNNKTLSFTEYTLNGFSQERPEELPKKGQVVWGKNIDENSWHIGHFHIFDKNSISLKYCISSNPLGNKTLWVQQITTTNPYEDEQ